MLQGIPSLRVMRQRGERGSNCLSPNDPLCWVPVGLGNCPMTVYLDGRRLNDLSKPPEHAFAFGVDALALPTHVAGIEVYTTGGELHPNTSLSQVPVAAASFSSGPGRVQPPLAFRS